MSRSRHTEAQMNAALKQVEAERGVEDVARESGCRSTPSTPGRRSTGDGWEPGAGAKQLRDENTRLRKLVADLSQLRHMGCRTPAFTSSGISSSQLSVENGEHRGGSSHFRPMDLGALMDDVALPKKLQPF